MAADPAPPKGWRAKLRHAFAVEPDGPVAPPERERALLEDLLRRIVARGMTAPTILMLEGFRPMGALGAQGMHALAPFAGTVVDPTLWEGLARWLQRRGSLPWLLERLEAMQADADAAVGRGGPGDAGAPKA